VVRILGGTPVNNTDERDHEEERFNQEELFNQEFAEALACAWFEGYEAARRDAQRAAAVLLGGMTCPNLTPNPYRATQVRRGDRPT
jgi:hypothetical protein